MKIRNGFVSNSSTSSFVCDFCGEQYTGWDASPYDKEYDCSICENEHVLCNMHLKEDVIYAKTKFEGCGHNFDRKNINICPTCGENAFVEEDSEMISAESCPICSLEAYSEHEMVSYLIKTRGIPKDIVFNEVKALNKRRRKLHDNEYILYVFNKFSLTEESILTEIKEKFSNYDNYYKFLQS
jgi:hypothetical protein